MKKHTFDSLSAFYADIVNRTNDRFFTYEENHDNVSFRGLSLADIKKYKFSYPLGVEMFNHLAEVKIEKAEWLKFYNSFDGYDIDIDRMFDGLDFLIDKRKQKKLPKTIDIFVNISESARVDYKNMLNKTYAAVKIIDQLETLGVRTALFVTVSWNIFFTDNRPDLPVLMEICAKNYSDALNLGAICTAISPWMFRYWVFQWTLGNYKNVNYTGGLARPTQMPKDELPKNAILIDRLECHTLSEANYFIKNIKLAS